MLGPMRFYLVSAALILAVAACATPPEQGAPATSGARKEAPRSLLPGTIGAVVEPAEGGVRVQALDQDGPGARAGLQVGDVIMRCANAPVATTRDFNQRVLATRPGGRLRLDVRRNAQPLRLDVDVVQLRTALRP